MMQATGGLQAAIAAANQVFMQRVGEGDAAGLAALYTEQGQVLPPNGDFVTGREGIQAMWQSVMDMGIRGARMDIVEVEDHGNTAIEISKYTLFGEGGTTVDEGKYMVVWKVEGGEWKLHRDIFNSSMPPPG
jgi:uncharacterized protein (TIGR02246 family)